MTVTTPPGLLGKIAGHPALRRSASERRHCPAASQIGTTTVLRAPARSVHDHGGKVYLTGPYKGQPFGLSIVVPAVAGPFNLGNVTRARRDRGQPGHGGADGREQPAAAARRRRPDPAAHRDRRSQPAGSDAQRDRLCRAGDLRDSHRRTPDRQRRSREDEHGLERLRAPVAARACRSSRCSPLRQTVKAAKPTARPRRQARVRRARAGEHRQARPANSQRRCRRATRRCRKPAPKRSSTPTPPAAPKAR